jgi:hypothetical protein
MTERCSSQESPMMARKIPPKGAEGSGRHRVAVADRASRRRRVNVTARSARVRWQFD